MSRPVTVPPTAPSAVPPAAPAARLRTGVRLAFACLLLLGVMPVISNGRPAGAGALAFAFWLSVWQLACGLPWQAREWRAGARARAGRPAVRSTGGRGPRARWTVTITLVTGLLFALSTWLYVLALQTAGAVDAAIALQAYPLFAAGLEALLLGRRRSRPELAWTLLVVASLYHLVTSGTWRPQGLSPWLGVALAVPALWSVAHVVLRELLVRTSITPHQVTMTRLAVTVGCLGPLALALDGPAALARSATDVRLQAFAALMGAAYYAELVAWFHAVRHVEVSLASTVTVPAPAVTLVLAAAFLGERPAAFQLVSLAGVCAGLVGLLRAAAARRAAGCPPHG